MFPDISSRSPAATPYVPVSIEPVHLMFVETPRLTPRGWAWLARSQIGDFDGIELERLIRFEKLSLG
jgi:hypothetical protein